MSQQASQRKRCARACEPCKRRKERCNGTQPCLLCERRGQAALCSYGADLDSATASSSRQEESPHRPAKKQRTGRSTDLSLTGEIRVSPTTHSHQKVRFKDTSYHTGSSGTLALLYTVGKCAEDRIGEHDFVQKAGRDFLIEDAAEDFNLDVAVDRRAYEGSKVIDELVDAYLTFTRGVYDMFDDESLRSTLVGWHFLEGDTSITSAVSSLVLAIGACQRGQKGDDTFAKTIFGKAYHITLANLLEPPSIITVQELMLISLYLFVVFRRNVAFTLLGAAARAAEALSLPYDDHSSVLKTEEQMVRTRAWKYLRILDVSSCASLGRILITKKIDESALSVDQEASRSDSSLADRVDTAGLRLCSIAESILVQVYERAESTVQFAKITSQRLSEWAQGLPDILILDQDDSEFESRHLSEQLCLNHLTCAYYWTIILLTRPFLEHVVVQQCTELAGREDFQVLGDACIHSAIRCLDATGKLLQFTDLPRKLYLINNTTLVSALVLGLASFSDAYTRYPLAHSLNKAEEYLSYVSKHDKQAQLYLNIVFSMKSAIDSFHSSIAEQRLRHRSARVDQLFGNVVEKGKASCFQAGYAGFEYVSMTSPPLDQDTVTFPASPTYLHIWDELRAGTALPSWFD